ncbi:MAG: late competence development ComFB family protein [Treponema sp.]|jgi:competence protein ComFB|nr:late competence development ComFB family protein [Treponema sp.]
MGFYNSNEDKVTAKVNVIFDLIEKGGNPQNICTCNQCRTDTICYVLNRMEPHYVVSNRGLARIAGESIKYQQKEADMVSLIYEGMKQVNRHMRPFAEHNHTEDSLLNSNKPVFMVPAIIGRIFNGTNFAPLEQAQIELLHEQVLVPMIDSNWQNPYNLVSYIAGIFTFLPYPLPAESKGIHKNMGFSLIMNAPGFEELRYSFEVPVISNIFAREAVSLERIFRLPDLYMFPPSDEAQTVA